MEAIMDIPQPKIVVFTTPTCSWCKRLKQYLKEKHFKFKEMDVSKNQRAAKELMKVSGQMGVPVTLINRKPVVGFDRAKINRLLGIKK